MQGLKQLGYTVRPAGMDDLERAVVLFNTCSKQTLGVERHDANDLRTEWKTPNFDLETDTQLVFDGDDLVGYGEFWDIEDPHVKLRFWGRVRPDYCDRGIGTAIVEWAEGRAQKALPQAPADAQVTLSQAVSEKDDAAQALLNAHNYELVRHFRRMRIDFDGPIVEPAWPEGIDVRTFDPAEGLEPIVRSFRDAFQDHWGYVENSFEEELRSWQQWVNDNEKFDPSLWFLAVEGGEIVGMSLCQQKGTENPELGLVDVLGVRRPWRRRGIALALLHHSFRELRERGQKGACLGVDATSLTGANRLYEGAGMRLERRIDVLEKVLRPGVDLSRQTL